MPQHAAPRRLTSRLLVVVAGWWLLGGSVAADPQQDQRIAFKQAWAVAQQGGDGWRSWAKTLADYPLYPYLEAAALSHDLRQLDRPAVESYLQRYPGMIPANDLRRDFLLELARRQDWNDFLALYRPGLGDALSCDALQARLAQGGTLDFERDLATLWTRPSLPNACDPVLEAARSQGLLTPTRLWTRIDRAIGAGQAGTVAALAAWLPAGETQAGQRLALALRDPAGAAAEAKKWPDTPRHRQAAALAVQRLARRQSASADAAWQALQPRFAFSTRQRDDVLYALALYHATDFDENALARLAALPEAARTDASREWRVRVALARQDWPAVLAAIQAMPAGQRQEGEWRYFRARALAATGHDAEAQALYADLADEASYFGFMAADRLGRDYAICPLEPAADPQREQALLADPGLQRAFELYAVDLPKLARREWAQALDGSDPATLRLAADLAYRRGWYDRAVFAFSSGEALRYYEQRFPLASQDGVVPQAEQAGIDPAWAYAIARAESAWVTDARSGADARGLMQLVPATAALVARRNGLDWNGGDSLYDPATNIRLGTRYLAQVAARFDGAPWLASAAYNAGPAKVDQWLAARGTLDPDLFVASMPYKETREYVARVMAFAVIYDWRLSGKALPMSTRMTAIGQPYGLPDGRTPRRQVACPAVVVPAPAESVAPASAGTAVR
ncbi:lytic transglycosylase [Frateuria sp. Soil773]|uniref:transglycosylase SLT domain-containing protein n=1 Tax=Frateuria sp. Soil773 TaxID=1736407 RepID=UPI0006F58D58|nr:transglycosylase SLT domain-containing protein [Frateuria sp. Soil773]KRF01972.1 lytic transglycosylase [Frateuria sp. Soil773]